MLAWQVQVLVAWRLPSISSGRLGGRSAKMWRWRQSRRCQVDSQLSPTAAIPHAGWKDQHCPRREQKFEVYKKKRVIAEEPEAAIVSGPGRLRRGADSGASCRQARQAPGRTHHACPFLGRLKARRMVTSIEI
jgi:hypothetical protein